MQIPTSLGATSISLLPFFLFQFSKHTDFLSLSLSLSSFQPSLMEGEDLNCLYQILESSSHFWPPLNSVATFSSPQNCNISSPNQNSDTTTNPPPPPPPIHQNDVVDVPQHQAESIQQLSENPNNSSSVVHEQAVSNERGKQKQKKKSKAKQKERENERDTWYKGPWTKTEDRKLCHLVIHFGRGEWAKVARHMNGRIGKQCRERWHNNLRPNIRKNTVWSDEEEMMIIEGHKRFGNRWSAIAKFLPGRSENDVKNHWNSIKRRQKTIKKISRPKRLRGLYQSPILENYIKFKFFRTAPTSSRAAAAANSPPIATSHPPPFTITSLAANSPPISSRAFTITTTAASASASAAANTRAPAAILSTTTPITAATTFIQPRISDNNALISTFSTTAATVITPSPTTGISENYNALIPTLFSPAATFTPPPIITITESNNALSPTFSTTDTATFTPPPITTINENYNAIFPAFSTAATAAFTPPPITRISENYNALSPTFSTTNAATFTPPPPITAINENYNAIFPAFSAAATAAFTPPPITTISENYINALSPTFPTTAAADTITLPPFTAITENNALISTDLPLSVEDYDTDGIPYFAFERAIDEDSDLMLQYFTSESAIDEISELMQNMYCNDYAIDYTAGNGEGMIRIHPSPMIGEADYAASTSYFTAETTVDEEMNFMRSLFGNNGEI